MTFKPAALALAATLVAAPFAASAADGVEIGQLTCRQTDRTNLILFSEAKFSCIFNPTEGPNERYRGEIDKVGLELTDDKVETIVWYVFAPREGVSKGSLEGAYYGVSADAAIGAGAGARVLLGGFERSITLQPAAVSAERGIGVAAGIEEFELFAVE